jgi:cobalt-zinc-cadmium resistance protein CzcA
LKRFTYLSAGVAVPLFSKAQRARIAAWDWQIQRQENDLQWRQKQVYAARDMAKMEILKYRESIERYQKDILPNAQSIIDIADKQFSAGDIDYLQWTMLVQQSLQVQQQFLTEQYNFNLAVLRFQQFSKQ